MKNVLIIGGSYFAGRVCVEELVKQPDLAIHVFNRGRQPLRMNGVTEFVGDRSFGADICDNIPERNWDVVIDFCAYGPRDVHTLLANLTGTVKQYILISTTSVLEQTGALPATEDAPKLTGPQTGVEGSYAWDKLRAEWAAHEFSERMSIAYTILRPAIIYGYYNYAPRESYFFDLLRKRQPIVIPDNDPALFSFIWVVDMARLIIRCIGNERTLGGTFNLAADEAVSYARIVEVLAEITGKQIAPVRLPVAEINRQGIPLPFPLDEHLLYSGEKLRRLFDFEYTPFKQGLREALRYYLMVQKQRGAPAA
jgi:2'-hydroxyisoflavone reductase